MDLKDQFGGWGPGDDVLITTHMLISGISDSLRPSSLFFVVVSDVVTKFSKIRSVFFFR